MIFQVDFQAGKPVYLQLADQIRYAAACGRLQPGEALPALRPLAEELRINRNTIAKAYACKQNKPHFSDPVRKQLLQAEIDEAVVMAHHLQVDREKFLALSKE